MKRLYRVETWLGYPLGRFTALGSYAMAEARNRGFAVRIAAYDATKQIGYMFYNKDGNVVKRKGVFT